MAEAPEHHTQAHQAEAWRLTLERPGSPCCCGPLEALGKPLARWISLLRRWGLLKRVPALCYRTAARSLKECQHLKLWQARKVGFSSSAARPAGLRLLGAELPDRNRSGVLATIPVTGSPAAAMAMSGMFSLRRALCVAGGAATAALFLVSACALLYWVAPNWGLPASPLGDPPPGCVFCSQRVRTKQRSLRGSPRSTADRDPPTEIKNCAFPPRTAAQGTREAQSAAAPAPLDPNEWRSFKLVQKEQLTFNTPTPTFLYRCVSNGSGAGKRPSPNPSRSCELMP